MSDDLKHILTPAETARRAELEAIIKPGIFSAFKVGEALREMCDSRLYRNTHSTFKAYVEEVYATGVRTAYELMDHSETVKALPESVRNFAQNATPSQTRPLKKVPPTKRAKVVESAQKQAESEGRQMTAADVKRAAECEVCPPEPPQPDQSGNETDFATNDPPRIRTADEILADQVAAAKATLSPIANDPEFDGATAEFRAKVITKWHHWLDRNFTVPELPIVRRILAAEIKRA